MGKAIEHKILIAFGILVGLTSSSISRAQNQIPSDITVNILTLQTDFLLSDESQVIKDIGVTPIRISALDFRCKATSALDLKFIPLGFTSISQDSGNERIEYWHLVHSGLVANLGDRLAFEATLEVVMGPGEGNEGILTNDYVLLGQACISRRSKFAEAYNTLWRIGFRNMWNRGQLQEAFPQIRSGLFAQFAFEFGDWSNHRWSEEN